MELDHDFTVPVPVDQAWSVLLDVERVAACMPGATLDSVDGEEYSGRMRVKVGAMTITYRGTARITSADEASRVVTMEASAKEARGSGTAAATVQARLSEEDGTTRVAVHTKLNVTGRPAQFGRNILSEVGSKIIARFARQLADELEGPGEPAGKPAEAAAEPPATAAVAPESAGKAAEPEAETGAASAAPEEPADKPGPVKAEPGERPSLHVAPAPEEAAPEKAAPEKAAPEKAAPEKAAPAEGGPVRRAESDDAIDLLEFAGPSIAKRAVPAVGGAVALVLAVRFLVRRRRRR
ncbi:hypothetical protein GWI34_26110 [Actinomadura sp. DSM 109109]|nr:hypothetical protein [Actinomadura lepetitiana]